METSDQTTVTTRNEDELRKEIARQNRVIAELQEKDRIRSLKRAHTARQEKTALVHPRDDTDFAKVRAKLSARGCEGLVAAIMAHGGGPIHAHFDPGPHPAGKLKGPGWECTPGIRFEFDIRAAASKHGCELPTKVINDAAATIEARVERRIHKIHDQVHRAINSIGYLVLQELGGKEPKWWLLHDDDEEHGLDASHGGPAEGTDATNAKTASSYEARADPDDADDQDAPSEYYEMRDDSDYEDWDDEPSREDDEDGSVDDANESLDDTEEETSDDEEDDDQ